MRASEELAKRQREWPLGQAGDRGAALFGQLVPLADPALEAMRLSQALVVGEVNRPLPNAKTFQYPDGSHATMLFAGIFDFFENVTKILSGATHMHHEGKIAYGPLSQEDVVAELQALFERWTPEGIAAGRHRDTSPADLSTGSTDNAAALAQSALFFVLSHELGHVTCHRPSRRAQQIERAAPLTRAQEFKADTTGLGNLIGVMPGPAKARLRFAGAVISLRVLAVFASLGHTFPGDHPQPLKRLRSIISFARSNCLTERDFWDLSPIAYAYDEQLETAGLRAAGLGQHPAISSVRSFSRLSAALEHSERFGMSPSAVVGVMRYDLCEASPKILKEIAGTAARMFPPSLVVSNSPSLDSLWAAKARIFRSLHDQWPERAKIAFHLAFQKLYPTGR